MNISKSIRCFLIASTLVTTLPYSNYCKASSNRDVTFTIVALVAGLALLGVIGTIFRTIRASDDGERECRILEQFRRNCQRNNQNQNNTNQTHNIENAYKRLKIDARNLYFSQCPISSTSLSSDHPIIWLEKSATSNKNHLSFISTFTSRFNNLIQRLRNALSFIRRSDLFHKERRKYNKKYRTKAYRNQKISLKWEKLVIEKEKLQIKRDALRKSQKKSSNRSPLSLFSHW